MEKGKRVQIKKDVRNAGSGYGRKKGILEERGKEGEEG